MVDVKTRIEMRNEWVPRPSSAWAGSPTAKDQSRLLKNSFQRPQLPSAAKQFAEKALGIALFYHSCHSDAERGGGICGAEELCIHGVSGRETRL
jgi:hypothetical protein